MILPRGITGFNVPRGLTPPDVGAWVADCWAAVGPVRGRVEDRTQVLDGSPTTFGTRVLVLPRGEVTVLLHNVYPWVGFCRPLTPGLCRMEFLDAGRVAKALSDIGRYCVLEARELEQPLTDEMCVELGRGSSISSGTGAKSWSQG